MKKIILIIAVLSIAVVCTACINNFAVQELNNKAKVFLENGDYENAINRLEASIDLDSTIFETHYNLGVAYIKDKKFEKAVNILTKAIKLQPSSADAHYSLAVAQDSYAQEILNIKQDDIKKSCNDLNDEEENIKQNPIYNMSPEERKLVAIDLYKASVESYNKYLELSPKASDIEDINLQIKEIEEELQKLGAK